MSWYEAYAFTQWLNEQPGLKPSDAPAECAIRLARECEWEKAARYPDGRLFPWGDDFDASKLNSSEGGLSRTSAVGIYSQAANPAHGTHDLSGNVWEWCLTAWVRSYTAPDAENNDPAGTARRVVRGGAWGYDRDRARAASRSGFYSNLRLDHLSFRVVCGGPLSL